MKHLTLKTYRLCFRKKKEIYKKKTEGYNTSLVGQEKVMKEAGPTQIVKQCRCLYF